MSYETAVAQMYALGHELAQTPSHKFDLTHMRVLLSALGHPENSFPTVLVAGTNGKGSTAATLASILQASGLKTGLYTSPHLIRINERIRLDVYKRQVRARDQDRSVPGGPADRVHRRADRALAVGARDQHAAQARLGIAERRQQGSSALEPGHDAPPSDRVERRHGARVRRRGHAQCQASFIASPGSGRLTSRRSAPIQARRRSPGSSIASTSRWR